MKAFAGLLAILLCLSASPTVAKTESDYRNRFCEGMGQEVVLQNGTRVDCLTDRLAIEVDWTHKWAEAIGQAMLYSASTQKLPGIILVCKVDKGACQKHDYLINEAVAYWHLPITVWLCAPIDLSLAACSRRDY